MEQHIRLAQTLPKQLTRFFARYPPHIFANPSPTPAGRAPSNKTPSTSSTPPSDPNAAVSELSTPTSSPSAPPAASPSAPSPSGATATASAPPAPHNPFQPSKNFVTGRWRSPVYSLRRQADLAKLARQHGVEELLPYTKKRWDVREFRRAEVGKRFTESAGESVLLKKPKGHKWERQLKGKLEKRREAMEAMPQMIQDWKQRGHGRFWKKWPK